MLRLASANKQQILFFTKEIEMKKLNKEFTLLASTLHSRKARIAILVLTLALFVLSAGAPNASIGIGK